jgi:zinc protease
MNPDRGSRGMVYVSLFFLLFIFLMTAEAAMVDQVQEAFLSNGLKVLMLENHKVPEITFQVWYRVGSRNEEWGKTGLSHMLEHMMFKGTKTVSGETFTRAIEEIGGNDNAFTSKDFTAYFENVISHKVQVPLELEADRMHNLLLRQEDFVPERSVVMEERRMRTEDSPQAYLVEQLEATAFQTSPYHWPTIGWAEDIDLFTLEDLKQYYGLYYHPANAFLVVVGDFRKEDLLPRLEKAFGPIPKGKSPDQTRGIDPPQTGERRIYITKEAELAYVLMGYHVPNLRQPDGYVLEVMAAILSGGKSSRFYQNLVRDKQLALDADVDNALLSRDPGLFTLSAQPFPGKETAELEKALLFEVERLQREKVGDTELEKSKNQLEAAFIYGQDSLFYQAMMLAQHEIAGSWKTIGEYIPAIRKVTAEDIQKAAEKYLVPKNRTVGILIPLPPKEGQPAKKISPEKGELIR